MTIVKTLPVNAAQKELYDLLELVHPKEKLKEKALKRVIDEQRKRGYCVLQAYG